jgi:hypothetical protein
LARVVAAVYFLGYDTQGAIMASRRIWLPILPPARPVA